MTLDATVDLDLDPVDLLNVLAAFRKGDFHARMPIEKTGLGGKIADALNEVLDLASTLLAEFVRVAGVVGKEGKINQRVEVPGAVGGWAAMIGNMNGLVGDLVQPMSEMSRVIGAVAKGDLTQSVSVEVEGRPLKGEFLRTAKVVNGMVEHLALTSKYKSEFLANMSHELRTPLNSLLILSKILEENAQENMNPRQVEYAATIHAAGNDLLALINDVLDLAKIESGTMALDIQEVPFREVLQFAERTFLPVAEGKGLKFPVGLEPGLPRGIRTDPRRLQQVIRNLLSNACKFTEAGSVELRIGPALDGWSRGNETLNRAPGVVAFSVRDTGIGIDPAKHRTVFEAFQQADGTTSRKYGGTGLGLSISREIARMFGGEITLDSAPGQGSRFTLYLPLTLPDPFRLEPALRTEAPEPPVLLAAAAAPSGFTPLGAHPLPPLDGPELRLEDDRESVGPGDPVLLAVEDDPDFAKILVDLARHHGFKAVVTATAEHALGLARKFAPCAITLDLGLPGQDGWSVLDRLKHDPALCHVPVHIISVEEDTRRGLRMGARAFLHKPVSKQALEEAFQQIRAFAGRRRRLLVATADEERIRQVRELLDGPDLDTVAARTGQEALAELQAGAADCLVLDPQLPDLDPFQLLERVREACPGQAPPVVLQPGPALPRQDEEALTRLAGSIPLRVAPSPGRLLLETTLLLHRPQAGLGPAQRQLLVQFQRRDPELDGRTVLVVDDDIRNIFALTAALEGRGVKVLPAESGREALAALAGHPEVDLVFMDLMLPEMDGYETMRAIRAMDRHRDLPLVALTAKAMQGEREKSLAAGASDYVTKPVDPEQVFSVIRLRLEGRVAP